MRPVIKRRRIDPRYFLHESVEEIKLSQTQQATMDTDDDGDIDAKDLATLRKGEEGKKEHEKSAKGADKDPQTKGTQELLLGDKSLYEKIRGAIEEVFDEYMKEENLKEATPAENAAEVASLRRAKGMKQAASGEWYTDKPGHAVPEKPHQLPGKKRADDYLKSVEGEGAFTTKRGGGN